jgi:hypothetical protein
MLKVQARPGRVLFQIAIIMGKFLGILTLTMGTAQVCHDTGSWMAMLEDEMTG